jgi:hypothetical protein
LLTFLPAPGIGLPLRPAGLGYVILAHDRHGMISIINVMDECFLMLALIIEFAAAR